MFYLTLKKNFNYKFSYILVLMNSKRRILRKIGTFAFNKSLNCFVLIINFIQLLFLFKNGIFFSKNFYRFLYFYINYFKV
jgi:hypothetical protein